MNEPQTPEPLFYIFFPWGVSTVALSGISTYIVDIFHDIPKNTWLKHQPVNKPHLRRQRRQGAKDVNIASSSGKCPGMSVLCIEKTPWALTIIIIYILIIYNQKERQLVPNRHSLREPLNISTSFQKIQRWHSGFFPISFARQITHSSSMGGEPNWLYLDNQC